jgi:ArsR family transcriptional regulator
MNALNPDALLARLGSLADAVRLRLLALLERQELGVGELAEILQLPQSSVSRHLKVLAEQGWVVSRAERTANLYTMADGELPATARALWQLARAEMASWPALEHDALRLERRLAERATGARSFYAGVAERWEELRAELYGRRFTEAALAALLPRDWVVADLACGAGDVAVRLAPRVAKVIGVDASPEMLATARRRAGRLANVELYQGDLAALPLADASVDAALLVLALTHVEEPRAALGEMARILRSGGRAVVVDLLHHDRDDFRREMGQLRNGFASDELAGLLADAGLVDIDCAPLPPEAEAKGPALLLAAGTRPAARSSIAATSRRSARRPR